MHLKFCDCKPYLIQRDLYGLVLLAPWALSWKTLV